MEDNMIVVEVEEEGWMRYVSNGRLTIPKEARNEINPDGEDVYIEDGDSDIVVNITPMSEIELSPDEIVKDRICPIPDGRMTIPEIVRANLNLNKEGIVYLSLSDSNRSMKLMPIHKFLIEG